MYVVAKRLGFAFGILAGCALATACAVSERPSNNGQSHWLESCESDNDCGGLSCLCGVCTTACSEDRECELHAGGDAVCRSADVLSDVACGSDRDAPSLCVRAEPAPPIDASVAMTADASRPDATAAPPKVESDANTPPIEPMDANVPTPPDPVEMDPLHLDCDGLGSDALPATVQNLGGEGGFGGVVSSGAAIAWIDGAGLHYRASPTAQIESFARDVDEVVHDDTAIFYTFEPQFDPPTVDKVTLPDHDIVNVASESVANIGALALGDDAVYWSSDQGLGDADTVTIWRSDREPDTTVALGSAIGISPHVLIVHGEWLYFPIGLSEDETQLYRLRRDGSEPAEAVGAPQANLHYPIGDGSELFGFITPQEGSDHRVVRIDPEDGSLETLFETQRVWTATLDAEHIYWIANASFGEDTVAIWRGRRDGQGDPVMLAEGWYHGGGWNGLAVSDDGIYFNVSCEGANVLRLEKPSP